MTRQMQIKGKKVVDATKNLVLKITPDDVKRGKSKQPDQCAAAVAAIRQCYGALSAHVHLTRVYVEYPDKVVRYYTPSALRTEIVSFDRGHRFQADEYELRRIQPSHRVNAPHRGGKRKTRAGDGRSHPGLKHHLTGVRVEAPKKAHWK